MDGQVLEYCARGIVRYLAGDMEQFRQLVDKAMKLYEATLCTCGKVTIPCKYGEMQAELCTNCGKLWTNGRVVRKCLVRRKIA